MLGDVGGLFEILQIGLSVFCGFFARNLFLISQVTSFFQMSRTSTQSVPAQDSQSGQLYQKAKKTTELSPEEALSGIEPLKITSCEKLLYILSCGLKRGTNGRALKIGRMKLKKSLDLVSLMRQERVLNTMLRLFFGKNEQRLIEFQRREAVIELGGEKKNNESSSDGLNKGQKLLKKFKSSDLQFMEANLQIDFDDASNLDKLRRGVLYSSFNINHQTAPANVDSSYQVLL